MLNEPNRIEAMQERQKLRNDKSKYWAAVIGQNMSMAVCLMIPVFLICLIWTEVTLPDLGVTLAMETFVTAGLFIFADWASVDVGIPSGKLDSDYLRMQELFYRRKEEIKARGILKMGVFCDWQIAEELVAAKKALCRKNKIDWSAYCSTLSKMSDDELRETYGKVKGKIIIQINKIEPIELTPEMILGEKGNGFRGGISQSGDDYVVEQKFGWWSIVKSVLPIILTVGSMFSPASSMTWGRIIFTVYRLIAVMLRMSKGFQKGAKAYNTVEVKHRESQVYYIDKYEEFLNTPGLYEKMALRYGDGAEAESLPAAVE